MADPIVVVRELTKVFGSGTVAVRAVDAVDLEVQAGELLLVMGPSGSGKTTLLTMIGGLLRPTSGEVWVAGRPLHELTERDLPRLRRDTIGFVFQSFNLLSPLSALDNVLIALNVGGVSGPAADERARHVLAELGLDQRLGFGPDTLSGGERQRVSIARALPNNPPLILADEPTANLDSSGGRTVMRLLRAEADRGRAVVVVAHDDRVREFADRVLWLEDGRFKDIARLVTDPNCGMQVEEDSPHRLEVEGAQLRFCADGCRREYEQRLAAARPSSTADAPSSS